jgi:hypothetical protein
VTLKEVRSRSDWPSCSGRNQWRLDREMDTLNQASTWESVPRPAGKNIAVLGLSPEDYSLRRGLFQYILTCFQANQLPSCSHISNCAAQRLGRSTHSTSMARTSMGQRAGIVKRYIAYPRGSCMMMEPPRYEECIKRLRKSVYRLYVSHRLRPGGVVRLGDQTFLH